MAIEVNSPNGIPTGWTVKNITPAPNVTNTRRVQLLRNRTEENNTLEYFIGDNGLWKQEAFITKLLDGEQILGRYVDSDGAYHTLYGIAHNNGNTKYITIFKSTISASEVGDGMTSIRNIVEARLTTNKGIVFNEQDADKQKGLELKLNENLGIDPQTGKVNVLRDNTSIVSTDSKLAVGTVDCGDWVIE